MQELEQSCPSSSNTESPATARTVDPEPLEDFLNRVNEPLRLAIEDAPLDGTFHTDASASFLETFQGNSDLIGQGDPWYMTSLNTQETTPPLAKHSMQVLLRVFRTWPCMVAKGFQYPPIFHHSMIVGKCASLPLANCCTLIKMWYGQHDGASAMVQETITKEIRNIIRDVSRHSSPDEQSTDSLSTEHTTSMISSLLYKHSRCMSS